MTDQKPWRLEDLAFEPMGDDQREIARIDDVMIVRQQDGRFSINAPQAGGTLMRGTSTPL
jgi:hypothetical protein